MNKIKKSNLFSTFVVMLMMFSGVVFVGCEKNMFESPKDIIANSPEFEEYLVAHFKFEDEFENASKRRKIGEINGRAIYSRTSSNAHNELFENVVSARNTLIAKHPQYEQMSDADKNDMMDIAMENSAKLGAYVEFPVDRLKMTRTEPWRGYMGCSYRPFENYEDAYDACRKYSQTNNIESGGYIYSNGMALFFIDSDATDTTMHIPVWKNGALATFHFHPGDDVLCSPSQYDRVAMETMLQFGIDSMIIITNDSIKGYRF